MFGALIGDFSSAIGTGLVTPPSPPPPPESSDSPNVTDKKHETGQTNSFSFVNHCFRFLSEYCCIYYVGITVKFNVSLYHVIQIYFFNIMLFIFHFGKELALALFHGFCSPKITTPPRVTSPKAAANSESNEGRYYWNFTVAFKP